MLTAVLSPAARRAVLLMVAVLALLVPVVTTRPAQAVVPAGPTAVRAVPNGNGVYVTFEPVAGATSYEVYRDGHPLPWTGPLPTGPTGRLQYGDDGTVRGQHYVYSVRAQTEQGPTAFSRTVLTQWTDDGSRTWLSSRYGPAECARTGEATAPRVICTVQTSNGWQIYRAPSNVSWGNRENRAWFTVDGKINYCSLTGSRPDRTRVTCLELGEQGWGRPSTSPVTDWGLGANRTWIASRYGPALCARTETGDVPGLVCTVRTDAGWKTFRTAEAIEWGQLVDRAWLTVDGKINYCAAVGGGTSNERLACVTLGADGWGPQSVSHVTTWGDPVNRTWVVSGRGPALCATAPDERPIALVCTTWTPGGWRVDRAPVPTGNFGYMNDRGWLSVGGDIVFCNRIGDARGDTRVACRELGKDGWAEPSVSPVVDWGDQVNRTWMVSADGPALCARTGQHPDGRVTCTVRKDTGWASYRSPRPVDWGYGAERAWTNANGKISYCDQVGDWSVDQRVACLELGTEGWGDQIISGRTDWGDNQP